MAGPQVGHRFMAEETSNLLSTVERSLTPATYRLLDTISEKASQIGMPLYLVGGSVRDALLGLPVEDLDLVVEGDAATLAFEVSKAYGGDVPAYSQFGTATLKLNGQRIDLATARQETYLRPGALPRVTPSTIQEDLGRRDFSINSMAVSLSVPDHGSFLDPYAGRKDISQGLIRILHPASFVDDATRILRAIRYEQRLNFVIEENTGARLSEAVNAGMMDTISGDRIRRELGLMFKERDPSRHLPRAGELGVLKAIFPPMGDGTAVRALAGHRGEGSHLVYLGALAYPLAPEEGEAFIQRLRMPSSWAKVVRDTITLRLWCGEWTKKSQGSPGRLCEDLDGLSLESVQNNALLPGPAQVKDALGLYLTTTRYVKPQLSGKDIISLGIASGPLVGEILRELKRARIEGVVNTKEEEIRLVESYLTPKGP